MRVSAAIGRVLGMAGLGLVLAFGAASPAFAAAPPTGPMVIEQQNFDGAFPPSDLTVQKINNLAPPPAWWGRTSAWKHSGTYSLWCAGSGTGTVYPPATAGAADFSVDLSQYYSSRLSFYYNEPSLGSADGDSFDVMWYRDGDVLPTTNYGLSIFPLTSSTSWNSSSLDLSAPWNRVNLSRTAGYVRFQFIDNWEQVAGYNPDGTPIITPDNARGVSIDDVSFTGYKYGPIRQLTATGRDSNGTVHLTWQRPYAATGSSVEDTRVTTYHVWRCANTLPYGAAGWTDLGTVEATSFADSSADPTLSYHYFAQACDPIPGAGYGVGDPQVDGASVAAVGAKLVAVEPIQGSTRFDTAIAAVQRAFPTTASTVVVAWGRNFPDALGGSALCGAYNAPLLLTETAYIPPAVRSEIAGLHATKAIIIGSESVVSKAVADDLATLVGGASHVQRVAGATRYDTASQVATTAAAVAYPATGKSDDVFLAVGDNFPDALAASPVAFAKKWPILLTTRTGLPDQTRTALNTLQPKRVHILGSTGAVPQAVEDQLKALYPTVTVDRWAGPAGTTRYQTAIDIANKSGLSWQGIALATGDNFPDALAGGVMQGKLGGVVLLTPTTYLHPDTAAAITAHKSDVGTVRYLGSNAAVADAVRNAVSQLLQ